MNAPKPSMASPAKCWICSRETGGAHFCPICGKIQSPPEDTDYFAFFSLPQKLAFDPEAFEQQFHTLSWKLHPDRFAQASEFERLLSLELSSQLNDAYRTLRHPVTRVEYLLSLYGMRKEGAKKQQAPPELLEEVFELNESLDELRAARSSGGNEQQMQDLRAKLLAEQYKFEGSLADTDRDLARISSLWDVALDSDADDAAKHALMQQMNETLNRRSYIRNLVEGVKQELAVTA